MPAAQPRQDALLALCAAVEWMLQHQLTRAGLNVWVDGVTPGFDYLSDAVSVVQQSEVRIHGYAFWGESLDGPFWHDPLRVHIQLGGEGLRYVLEFGNAACGLRSLPGKRHPRSVEWLHPAEWLYRFSNVRPD